MRQKRLSILITISFLFTFLITKFSLNNQNESKNKLENCEINFINNIPINASIVVGHAYGSPKTYGEFINKRFEDFLLENNSRIKNIFFTGDVFYSPSKAKWDKLYSFLGNDKSIIIAPGNHDVGNENSRFIFNNSVKQKINFPFIYSFDDFRVIVDDSTLNSWRLSRETIKFANQKSKNKKVLLIRHNIANREFLEVVNSKQGLKKELPKMKKLLDSINEEIIIVAGDGGAWESKERFFCKKKNNITFIVNGLGDLPGDIIIVLYENKIYKYQLN